MLDVLLFFRTILRTSAFLSKNKVPLARIRNIEGKEFSKDENLIS
jgi:hypothetical protein